MATIELKGNEVHTIGQLPPIGARVPDFKLTKGDLADVSLADFAGKVKIFNIVPSLDTSVCAMSAKKFEKEVSEFTSIVVLTVSRDLPFAQTRFCKAEGIENVIPLSSLRDMSFGKDFGVAMTDGPLAGLLSRAIVVAGKDDVVVYTQQVPDITIEPNYEKALEAAKKALSA